MGLPLPGHPMPTLALPAGVTTSVIYSFLSKRRPIPQSLSLYHPKIIHFDLMTLLVTIPVKSFTLITTTKFTTSTSQKLLGFWGFFLSLM
jgi:hypothetical protein